MLRHQGIRPANDQREEFPQLVVEYKAKYSHLKELVQPQIANRPLVTPCGSDVQNHSIARIGDERVGSGEFCCS
jgi:hypothetical protein